MQVGEPGGEGPTLLDRFGAGRGVFVGFLNNLPQGVGAELDVARPLETPALRSDRALLENARILESGQHTSRPGQEIDGNRTTPPVGKGQTDFTV